MYLYMCAIAPESLGNPTKSTFPDFFGPLQPHLSEIPYWLSHLLMEPAVPTGEDRYPVFLSVYDVDSGYRACGNATGSEETVLTVKATDL